MTDENIEKLKQVDFVFLFGGQSNEALQSTFNKAVQLKTNDTIVVMDEIHASKEMENLWGWIVNHPETKVSLDLFYMGIVFFRKELSPQHFVYRF